MSGQSGQISTLPPTSAIKDSATRGWLDAMANILDARSGNVDKDHPQRFITAAEFQGMAKRAVMTALGVPGAGAGAGFPGSPTENADAIENLADSIRKSLIYQMLEQQITLIDVGPLRERIDAVINRTDKLANGITKTEELIESENEKIYNRLDAVALRVTGAEGLIANETNLRVSSDQALFNQLSAVVLRVAGAEGAIVTERNLRVTANQALFDDLSAVKLRVGNSEGAIATETSVRVTEDRALASAINTMWAKMGGSQAVIQGGSVASATPNSAQATKWDQLQAAVTDPNTGNVYSSSIVADTRAYINAADGKFNSMYSVRAQVSVDGKTVVGGFGLSAVAGAGSAQGPVIDFGVRADKFFIAATSATPDAQTQIAQGNSIPFMVLTSNQWVNGVVYGPGVYIKKAVIGEATIDSAQIADLAVTNAKIGETIQSNNFSAGSSGWRITKSGSAEFNDIIIRRASLIASGYLARSDVISGTYQTSDSKGTSNSNYPPGSFIRGETFYIETGFTDYDAVANNYSAGFYGRIGSPSNSWITGSSGSGNIYELAFEVVAAPARTWSVVGTGTPGQRIVLCVTPIIKVLQAFTSVTINNYDWALFRQR